MKMNEAVVGCQRWQDPGRAEDRSLLGDLFIFRLLRAISRQCRRRLDVQKPNPRALTGGLDMIGDNLRLAFLYAWFWCPGTLRIIEHIEPFSAIYGPLPY